MSTPYKIPTSLWANRTLHLPPSLLEAYRRVLNRRGLTDQARSQTPSNKKLVGGVSCEETEAHFAHRYGVSACRLVGTLIDPSRALGVASRELLTIFSHGEVALLDAPCGTGAASLGVLCSLAELRRHRSLPTLSLNVKIHAADISDTAREIYMSMVAECQRELAKVGISVDVTPVCWDATSPVKTRDVVEEFRNTARTADQVVIVANFGAVGGSDIYEHIKSSLEHIKIVFAGRGTVLFVESDGRKPTKFLERILTRAKQVLPGETPTDFRHSYHWYDAFNATRRDCRIVTLLLPR